MKTLGVVLVSLVLSGVALGFQEKAQTKPVQEKAVTAASATTGPSAADVVAQQLPTYPLTECPVSHESLDAMGKPLDFVHEGRLVRLCCKSCIKGFQKDAATTAAVLKAIDQGVVEAQRPTYPLTTCAISGEELGSMGEPLDVVHGTRLVRLCCKGCVKGFQKDPAAALAKVDAALIAQQKPSYPLTTCLVSGEPIEGAGHEQLYGLRLTRFCCKDCAASFAKEPAKYLAKLDAAASAKKGAQKQ